MRSCMSSVPEPVISSGNGTWLLGGHPGTREGLRNTLESCSLGNVWHPSLPSEGAKPAHLKGRLLQEPSTRTEGLKCSGRVLGGEKPRNFLIRVFKLVEVAKQLISQLEKNRINICQPGSEAAGAVNSLAGVLHAGEDSRGLCCNCPWYLVFCSAF